MAFEDFTTYTEVDPGGTVVPGVTDIVWTLYATNDGDAYVYDDKGVDFFDTDLNHIFEIQEDFRSGSNPASINYILTNTAVAWDNMIKPTVAVAIGGGKSIDLMIRDDTFKIDQMIPDITQGVTYFITLDRDDSTNVYTCFIRTGSHTGTLEDTLTLTATAQFDFRYIYGFSGNSGANRVITGFTQNLDLSALTIGPVAAHLRRRRIIAHGAS